MKLPNVLSKSDISILFSFADEYLDDEMCFVLRGLYYTGMRISEFCRGFLIENIDLLHDEIKVVKCKNNKERIIPILPEFKPVLLGWLMNQRRSDGFVCVHRRNGLQVPLNTCTIHRKIKHLGFNCLGKRVHPHLFRSSIATHLDRMGFSITFIKDFLGHDDIVSTQVYIRLNINHLKNEINSVYKLIAFDDEVEHEFRKAYKLTPLTISKAL